MKGILVPQTREGKSDSKFLFLVSTAIRQAWDLNSDGSQDSWVSKIGSLRKREWAVDDLSTEEEAEDDEADLVNKSEAEEGAGQPRPVGHDCKVLLGEDNQAVVRIAGREEAYDHTDNQQEVNHVAGAGDDAVVLRTDEQQLRLVALVVHHQEAIRKEGRMPGDLQHQPWNHKEAVQMKGVARGLHVDPVVDSKGHPHVPHQAFQVGDDREQRELGGDSQQPFAGGETPPEGVVLFHDH